jgi:hypothetical protein
MLGNVFLLALGPRREGSAGHTAVESVVAHSMFGT